MRIIAQDEATPPAADGRRGTVAQIRPNTNALGAPVADHEFRKLAENIPTLCWIADRDGYILWYNAKWYEYTGTTPAGMKGWGWQSVHDARELPDILEQWTAAISAGEPFEMVFKIRGADGVLRPFLSRINPSFDAQGAVANWYGVNMDISLQVKAEDAAARTEARFRLLADSMPQLVWSARADGARDYHNARWYGYTGAPIGGSDGQAWSAWVHPEDREGALAVARQACKLGEPFQSEYRLRDRSGAYRWMLVGGQPERGDDGEVTRWYGAYTDIEDIVQARRVMQRSRDELEDLARRRTGERDLLAEALVQAQKLEAMGQLTGGVAHDFNNLLTPILGALDMLERRGLGGEREQRLIRGALESAERARTLVHRLLAFARRQPLQSVPVDVGGLVRGMAELVASAVGPTISVNLRIADGLPMAKADRHQLEMAILNLAVNARDAMEGSGRLTISVTEESAPGRPPADLKAGTYIRLCILDTGKGMDEATRTRAIEPFFSTKGVGQGTGLGLSMAHGLACQLGGALTIDSEPGAGAEIAIWLPQSVEPLVAEESIASLGGSDAEAGTVLLVDDEPHIRAITADMLGELGFHVHEASAPEAALAAVRGGLTPDILVTDHLMPGMTGVELARAVKALLPAARALIVSGFADVENLDPSLHRLSKPFVQKDLANALADLQRGADERGAKALSGESRADHTPSTSVIP
jgi:PAS domain S-box-containing protein